METDPDRKALGRRFDMDVAGPSFVGMLDDIAKERRERVGFGQSLIVRFGPFNRNSRRSVDGHKAGIAKRFKVRRCKLKEEGREFQRC